MENLLRAAWLAQAPGVAAAGAHGQVRRLTVERLTVTPSAGEGTVLLVGTPDGRDWTGYHPVELFEPCPVVLRVTGLRHH